MDRVLICRSSADQPQNIFGNVFSDEINRVLRENRFSYRYILCSDEIYRFDHLSSAPAGYYPATDHTVNMTGHIIHTLKYM